MKRGSTASKSFGLIIKKTGGLIAPAIIYTRFYFFLNGTAQEERLRAGDHLQLVIVERR